MIIDGIDVSPLNLRYIAARQRKNAPSRFALVAAAKRIEELEKIATGKGHFEDIPRNTRKMKKSIQHLLNYARAHGVTGPDEELMKLTLRDLATRIVMVEFDANAGQFTDDVMKRVVSDGPCEYHVDGVACGLEPSTHHAPADGGGYMLVCAKHSCAECDEPINYPKETKT